MSSHTNITSFVVRFVQETKTGDTTDRRQTDWRGIIKHVQTSDEKHFTRFAEAIAFINNYVDLDRNAPGWGAETRDSDS